MKSRNFYVYVLASRVGGTLYVGVTNDLVRRVAEHRLKAVGGFTERYNVARLVYFEQFEDPENAIKREKRLKKWNRAWKIRLERFRAKWIPVRVKKTRQNNNLELRSDQSERIML